MVRRATRHSATARIVRNALAGSCTLPRTTPVLQSVLFDFNGVLVDDEHIHHGAFNEVLEPLGVRMTDQAYVERYLGFDDRGAFQAVLRDHGHRADDALVHDLIARKAQVYQRRAASELRIFPGAADVLTRIAARVPIGIVSGALRAEIDLALEVMGVATLVGFIVAAEDVAVCKPDPEGYLRGFDRLGGLRGAVSYGGVVVIEDSVAGIEAARDAGLPVVAVAHTYERAVLERAGAATVFDTIAEITPEALAAVTR